jgi:PhzF family phenazine biosynthesis protein
MNLKMWQVDAFAPKALEGNPAALVPLESFLDAGLMLKIANENNLAETAFFVKTAPGKYDLRWFTPGGEVDLCGHATLASAWLIFETFAPELRVIDFQTRSGTLTVLRGDEGRHVMSLPSDPVTPYGDRDLAEAIGVALGIEPPREIHKGRYLMAVWDDPKTIRAIQDCGEIAAVLRSHELWGLIVTAPGDAKEPGGYDFVSRFFAPDKGVPEDPVTGSAHCALTPYWAKRLDKQMLKARQVSPRGGDLLCTDGEDRTVISGPCALYMTAEIFV